VGISSLRVACPAQRWDESLHRTWNAHNQDPILLIGMIPTRPAVCQSNHQEFDSRLGELPAAEPLPRSTDPSTWRVVCLVAIALPTSSSSSLPGKGLYVA
jgi:hypothetical protein